MFLEWRSAYFELHRCQSLSLAVRSAAYTIQPNSRPRVCSQRRENHAWRLCCNRGRHGQHAFFHALFPGTRSPSSSARICWILLIWQSRMAIGIIANVTDEVAQCLNCWTTAGQQKWIQGWGHDRQLFNFSRGLVVPWMSTYQYQSSVWTRRPIFISIFHILSIEMHTILVKGKNALQCNVWIIECYVNA